MHARNSTSLQATPAQEHSRAHDSVYTEGFGLVEDMEPLPTAGLILRPVAAPPARKMAKVEADDALTTLAITRVELAGEGGLNRVWRTDGKVDGRPVVLRIAKESRQEAGEIAEAERVAPLVDSMLDRPRDPGRMPVLPARVYGQVEIPTVLGEQVAGGAWERHATRTTETAQEPGASRFRLAKALVMEEAEGVSLSTAISLDKRSRLPLNQVRDLVAGMAQWIEEGRKAGVAHTDLKTSNVMIGNGQFTLIDHTPTPIADITRALGGGGGGALKGTFGYTDYHGMQKATGAHAQDRNDAALEDQLGRCQLRAAAVIALECLNAGAHPVTDHPNEERRGYMGAVEPETYEHALQQAQQRYNQEPAQTARFIGFLRDCIHRRIAVGDVETRISAVG